MVASCSINVWKAGHLAVRIVDILDILSLVGEPDCMINDVASEQCKSGIRSNALNRSIHALFETDRGIASVVSILASRVSIISWCISCGVRPTTNRFCAVVACSGFVEWVNVNIGEMNDLDWSLTADSWTAGGRFG